MNGRVTTDASLRLVGLTKKFGSFTAVDSLDLELRSGEVLGLLGPNGAGKTTTVGMILGLIAPTSGSVEYASISPRQIGAIVGESAFYPYLSGYDNLRALAIAFGGVPKKRVDELLEYVGMSESADRPYKTYSTGMKQRLGIASTLLNDPQVVILDEPTNGLDPAGQREVRALIPELAREGRSVILASHLLHEVEQVCDHVAILQRGRLIREGAVATLLDNSRYLEIKLSETDKAAPILRALSFVEKVTVRPGELDVITPESRAGDIARALAAADIYPTAMVPRHESLEELFLDLTDSEDSAKESDGRE